MCSKLLKSDNFEIGCMLYSDTVLYVAMFNIKTDYEFCISA